MLVFFVVVVRNHHDRDVDLRVSCLVIDDQDTCDVHRGLDEFAFLDLFDWTCDASSSRLETIQLTVSHSEAYHLLLHVLRHEPIQHVFVLAFGWLARRENFG